ncbi:MAG: DUF1801 domain-containing protein [Elusimicrobia bacterium]|nr:DUF1801 domain-containing protein [Elusimicrobiota bacterium]
MKTGTPVQTTAEFFASLPSDRRADVTSLHALVRRTAPKLKPCIQSGMLGYGKYHYRYPSGREGEWCKLMLASQKNYISLYVCVMDGKKYLAEGYKKKFPKASIGKSCVRFKRLADLDAAALSELLARAAKSPAMGEN